MLPGGAAAVDYPGGHARGRGRPGPDTPKAAVPGFRGRRLRAGTGWCGERGPAAGKGDRWVDQAWEPAVHSAQLMFQPLRPLSGVIVLSGEFLTMTTSPTIELS